MNISSITTKAVNTWLQAVRLPLTTAERALGFEVDAAAWLPALWFEEFQATVRERAGSLLRDPQLREQAKLQRGELMLRRQADDKRAEAAELKSQAEAELEQRRREAAELERRTQRHEQERKAELEREKHRAETRVEHRSAERRAAMDEAAERRDRVVEATKRRATFERLDAEEEALKEKEKALKAREKALRLEDETRKAKAARKNGQ
jgi:hypothetical protein